MEVEEVEEAEVDKDEDSIEELEVCTMDVEVDASVWNAALKAQYAIRIIRGIILSAVRSTQ